MVREMVVRGGKIGLMEGAGEQKIVYLPFRTHNEEGEINYYS